MSLKRIALKDFVIVRSLEIELREGFTVLTGETGAGKSILIDALQLALGERAEAANIREGASKTEVSAEFEVGPALAAWLEQSGLEPTDGSHDLLVRRIVDTHGKSRAWVNGHLATVGQLRELGAQLLDIHGQHAWQSLTRPASVQALLDEYAGIDLTELQKSWESWRLAERQLTEALNAQESLLRERERLDWQIAELEKLNPLEQEWQELNTQHQRLSNAQNLLDAGQQALSALEDDEHGALFALHKAQQLIEPLSDLEPQFQSLSDVLANSLAQAGDVAHSLGSWLRKTDLEPDRLVELDQRLGLWISLARRYKRSPEELPSVLALWKHERFQLEAAADLDNLKTKAKDYQQSYEKAAKIISKSRRLAAPKLSSAITQAMQGLGMAGGVFEVQLKALDAPSSQGFEEVLFLVAGHPGSTPRPVAKVASGGELSRIALAIAVTTSELGGAETLIFDEIDAGVGGAVAETVGRLMKQLGKHRQVLAVTHLPQVAACADHHWVVSKQLVDHQTQSHVEVFEGENRIREIARMLGGEKLSDTSLAHAREMMKP
jgi:DNA repair protein RecN (Recombination protein N)